MAVTEGFKNFVRDLFADFGPVTIRNMFGGAGVYADGVMFAILAEDTLYLKTDAFRLRLRERGHEGVQIHAARQGAGGLVLLGGTAAPPGGAGGACFMGARSPSHRLRKQDKVAAQAGLTDFKTVRAPAA